MRYICPDVGSGESLWPCPFWWIGHFVLQWPEILSCESLGTLSLVWHVVIGFLDKDVRYWHGKSNNTKWAYVESAPHIR